MLPVKFIRENKEVVIQNIKNRNQDDKIPLVDEVLAKDEAHRAILKVAEDLRAKRNSVSKSISEGKKKGENVDEFLTQAKSIPQEIKDTESKQDTMRQEILSIEKKIPNIMHPDVPLGKDDSENVEDERFGEPKARDIPFHGDILEKLQVVDFDAARRVAGKGFHYLKAGLAELDNALIQFAIDFMRKKNYTMIIPPNMISDKVVEGVMTFTEKEEMMYKIEGEELYMIGTAEHSLIGMFQGTVIKELALPIKVFANTACYRKEIGAHGLDDKGCFRVHQFNKVEQIILCKPEDSMTFYNELLNNSIEILKGLDIPFRTLKICSGDLGDLKHIMHDLELWSPRKNDWIETMSCSNLTDAQARLLNIKVDGGPGNRYFPHILNDTAIATSRVLVSIIENNWDAESNTIAVPKALQKYMGGKESIGQEPKWFV